MDMSQSVECRVLSEQKRGELLGFLLAAIAVTSVHVQTGWWLNSSRGVGWTVLVLVLLAAALQCFGLVPFWRCVRAMWCGAMSALSLTLVIIGPGTIWPLVLAASGLITGVTVSAGGWLGRCARPGFRHLWDGWSVIEREL
jgi:hypothetical protein